MTDPMLLAWLPHDRTTNLIIWAVIWGLLLGWQAVTSRVDGLPAFVVISRLLRVTWLTRWVLLAGWIWLGWHIFVRTTY